MKIKFDYGKKPVPSDVVADTLAIVRSMLHEHFNINFGSVTAYVNLYNEDGESVFYCTKDGVELDVVVRQKPYKTDSEKRMKAFELPGDEDPSAVAYWVEKREGYNKYAKK